MSTPGRRRALKALAAARRRNKERVSEGKDAIIDGRHVSPATYKHEYGVPKGNERRHEGGLAHHSTHDCKGGLRH